MQRGAMMRAVRAQLSPLILRCLFSPFFAWRCRFVAAAADAEAKE